MTTGPAPESCVHRKDDGERCRVSNNLSSGGLCIWHDPARRRQAHDIKAAGGRAVAARKRAGRVFTVRDDETPGPPPETLEDAIRWAAWAVAAVATGKLDARTAHEIAYLCRTFMDGRRHLDKVDERVKELKDKLKALQAGMKKR